MGGGSGGGGSSTTVQKADPWSGVQPFLSEAYMRASGLYGSPGPQYFPGSTVATPNPLETTGQGMQLGNAAAIGDAGVNAYNSLQGMQALSGWSGNVGQLLQNQGTGIMGNLANQASAGGDQASSAASQLLAQGGGNMALGSGGLAQAAQGLQGFADQGAGANQGVSNLINQLMGRGTALTEGGNASVNRAMGQLSGAGQSIMDTGYGAANAALGQLAGQGGTFAQGGYGTAQNAMNQLTAAGDPANNPFFQQAVQSAIRPVTEQFREQVLPGIGHGAQSAGQFGSSRQGIAEGIASRGYMDTVGDITANMGNAAYAQGLGALSNAGSLGSNLAALGINAQGQAGQLGGSLAGMGLGAQANAGQLGSTQAGQGLGATANAGSLAQGQAGMGLNAQQAMGGLYGNLANLGLGQLQSGGQLGQNMAQLYGQMGLGLGNLGQSGIGQGITGYGQSAALTGGVQQGLGAAGQMVEQIGQQRTADQQAQLDAEINRWNYNQQLPYSMISDYLQLLQGAPGGQTSSTMQGGGGSRLGGVLGGAATGAALGSAFPVVGTGLGAGAGALLGLFM